MNESISSQPQQVPDRIVLLDTLRGFGVLGILLMNILAFGMLSPAYSYPGFDLDLNAGVNLWLWIAVELFGEGSMRGIFSLLFGAGVVLFTTGAGAKSASLHYRRMFYLLLFGLFDCYVLLWFGDILVCYALCGAALYPLRNWRSRSLLILAAVLAVLSSLSYLGLRIGLEFAQSAADTVAANADPSTLDAGIREAALGWDEFASGFIKSADGLAEEQALRSGSYASAFAWNVPVANEMLLVILPLFIFWDALLMMLLGMALFKLGVFHSTHRGGLSRRGAITLAVLGLGTGLLINGWEVSRALAAELSLMSVFAQLNWSYHLGRGAMALGYVGVLAWLLQWLEERKSRHSDVQRPGLLAGLMRRLAAVGRMALSNYLLHSLLALLIFTGAGLGLVGQFERAALYGFVLAFWALQLWLSPWWLARYRFGPVEYLWRWLTYARRPGTR